MCGLSAYYSAKFGYHIDSFPQLKDVTLTDIPQMHQFDEEHYSSSFSFWFGTGNPQITHPIDDLV